MNRCTLTGVALAATVLVCPNARAQTPPSPPIAPFPTASAPFAPLDNVEGEFVNFNPVAVRPMVFVSASGPHLYALNTYLGAIQHIDSTQQIVQTFRTLSGPVAIARYVAPSGPNADRLLVVCQNSDALVVHDRLTGEVLDVVYLPSQPADLVIDGNAAFVSSMAEDVVVEIDLLDPHQPLVRYPIASRKPMFLSRGPGGEVFVAPMLSGNNSVVADYLEDDIGFTNDTINPQAGDGGIVDLDDPTVATVGLPDEDLFFIDRANGVARAVARGLGTVLTGHRVVSDGAGGLLLYQLNIEMNNKDPNRQSRPTIQGEIAFNRLTRTPISVAASPGPLVKPPASAFIELDDVDPGTPGIQYDRTQSVGHPYALHVLSNGDLLVAGVLSDNIVRLNAAGQRITEWDLPDGCIPRQIVAHPSEQVIYTYCSGSNTIEVDRISPNVQSFATYSLGFDPTPEKIQRGRELFYDGSFSRHNNASCATCHVEGGIDLVAWNLGVPVLDDKGPMITQSLFASNRTGTPYWRGAQLNGLIDFNGAFEHLMGGTMMSPNEFDDFAAFVHSLEPPPNPYENEHRVLDDAIQIPDSLSNFGPNGHGSATAGLANFGFCNRCHTLPTGGADQTVDTGVKFLDPKPKRHFMKIAPLLTLPERGLQPVVDVTFADGRTAGYPLLGTAMAHAGNPDNIADFLLAFLADGQSPQEIRDWMNFLFQYDNGIAPSTRVPIVLDATTADSAPSLIIDYLGAQAAAGHCDVAVFARTTVGSNVRQVGWTLVATSPQLSFLRDDGQTATLADFVAAAEAGERFVFTGLPVGTARNYAVDADGDDLLNGQEISGGLYVADVDGDGFLDGHEVANGSDPQDPTDIPNDTTAPQITFTSQQLPLWMNQRNGRFSFSTDELTTWTLVLEPPVASGLPTRVFLSEEPSRHHSVQMRDLDAGVTYVTQLVVSDLGGNPAPMSVSFTVETASFVPNERPSTVVGDVRWVSVQPQGSTASFVVDVRVMDKEVRTQPEADHVVAVRPVVDGVAAGTTGGPGLQTAGPQTFCVHGVDYTTVPGATPGPFVVSDLSDANGWARLEFTLSGVSAGDVVQLSLEAVSPERGVCAGGARNVWNPLGEPFPAGWSFSDTRDDLRASAYEL